MRAINTAKSRLFRRGLRLSFRLLEKIDPYFQGRKNEVVFRIGATALICDVRRVKKPSVFNSLFKRGDYILDMHLNPSKNLENLGSRRYLVALAKSLVKNKARLKEAGYSGCFGYTSNTTLLNLANSLGGIEIPVPPKLAKDISRRIAIAAQTSEGAVLKKYSKLPVKGIAFVF